MDDLTTYYTAIACLALTVIAGGQLAVWREAFLQRVARERHQRTVREKREKPRI